MILNDHYRPGNLGHAPRGMIDGVLFVPGVEARGSGGDGSVLSFNLADDYDKTVPLGERIRRSAAAGGINVFGHVEKISDWTLDSARAPRPVIVDR